jgi:hypothetical protein
MWLQSGNSDGRGVTAHIAATEMSEQLRPLTHAEATEKDRND